MWKINGTYYLLSENGLQKGRKPYHEPWLSRGRSRNYATSTMESFVIKFNSRKPLAYFTKSSFPDFIASAFGV